VEAFLQAAERMAASRPLSPSETRELKKLHRDLIKRLHPDLHPGQSDEEARFFMNTEEGYKRPYPREERAFECFTKAAEAGICEACYKLGDMYKHGVGCEPDGDEAFRWYVRASELMDHEHPVILGSVALRLGECFEEGIGGPVKFSHALIWYRKAVDCLSVAVDAGEAWYAKALASARAGVERCDQEVALSLKPGSGYREARETLLSIPGLRDFLGWG